MTTSPAVSDDETPSCHDSVTMTCPVCQGPFMPVGRQRYCGDACRATAYRRRRDADRSPVVVPKNEFRKPITVYECDGCGARAVGEQRCEECRTFMRRVGIGGACRSCEEPVSIEDLLGEDVTIEAAGRPSDHRRA